MATSAIDSTSYEDLYMANQMAYIPNDLYIDNFKPGEESSEYEASTFSLLNKRIIFRKAKITPNKLGHFVTIWKRKLGVTTPYDENDLFDFLIISVKDKNHFGQFIFNKDVLLKNKVISSDFSQGKRGIRVYAPWVRPSNKTAIKTQNWQCQAFINLNNKSEIICPELTQKIGQ